MSEEKSNVVDMPKPDSAEPEAREATPEELEILRKQGEAEREKSRIAHLEAAAMNPLVVRDAYQDAILAALVGKPSKVKALCETYLEWAGMTQEHGTLDTSEVNGQVEDVCSRFREAIRHNSLVGRALFQKCIQEDISKGGTGKGLVASCRAWLDAEAILGEP